MPFLWGALRIGCKERVAVWPCPGTTWTRPPSLTLSMWMCKSFLTTTLSLCLCLCLSPLTSPHLTPTPSNFPSFFFFLHVTNGDLTYGLMNFTSPWCCLRLVPVGLPSRGGDVAVYVFDLNQSSLPTPFYSVLAFISVFMALSTVFHSVNSSDNS